MIGYKVTFMPGICDSCKHYSVEAYDPSPAGVSLGAGFMTLTGCNKEEEWGVLVEEGKITDNAGSSGEHQCPLWELAYEFKWCPKHGWYEIDAGCCGCDGDYYIETSETYK